jgi:hypothetical protein
LIIQLKNRYQRSDFSFSLDSKQYLKISFRIDLGLDVRIFQHLTALMLLLYNESFYASHLVRALAQPR